MKKILFSTLAVAGVMSGVLPTTALADHSVHESEAASAITMPAAHTTMAAVVPSAVPTNCEFTENLGHGARGDGVHCLQQELIKAGELTVIDTPTGNFGSLTVEALKKWQTAHAIPATGYLGVLTRAALIAQMHADVAEVAHMHKEIDISSWSKVPSVSIVLHEDAMGGWNLEVRPTNFIFAPEHVNGAVVANEGHTHVYINGVKITRLYGPWMYLAPTLFKKGENTVRVTLNANDHSDLELGGELVEASATAVLK
ncbi:MAG: peptidoglycan-binding protein [Candidatus Pacebacteria bacterium]|nr:peptidoglycan-binding protein [Candidatus Paceibacterota bacterium]